MVFHCRCFSFDEDEHIVDESKTLTPIPTKSTSTPTFYTPSSQFSNSARKQNNLRVFTLTELNTATNGFCSASKIGESRHGSVYKGMIKSLDHPSDKTGRNGPEKTSGMPDGGVYRWRRTRNGRMQRRSLPAANSNGRVLPVVSSTICCFFTGDGIKQYKPLCLKDWLAEINLLGMAEHPNLVKLVGYYMEDNEKGLIQLFLVYKYMPNGNVRDHLSTKSETPLSWTMRLKVAQDAARGLAYLHDRMDSQIIYRGFNSSRLLLDDQWNAKLSDLLDCDEFVGSVAYAAPEYIYTGHVSYKSDVWSYGVFLYELITGRQPLDLNRPENEQKLLEWVRPYVHSENLEPIIDPRLEGMCSMKSAQVLVTIANLCLKWNPNSRPKMSEVLNLVNGLIGVQSQVTSLARDHKTEPVNVATGVPLQPSKVLKSRFRRVKGLLFCMHRN
ncbi:hypothetical protein LXL04_032656 [Taraxacum kok-saghyz]